ncbi:MAG: cysteine desulfurase [Bacteroidetes bacterium]|nr:cysteine desulfurase [Bacteroidota bacterium]
MKQNVRTDFPILAQQVYGKPLIYFDNAATTQKPNQVLEEVSRYYREDNSNIHRGVHYLSQKATVEFEEARKFLRDFIHAEKEHEIIFTRGTTESINLVASSFGEKFLQPGDEILLTAMEHHSNIVPWQLVCEKRGASIKIIPVTPEGELDLNQLPGLISERTRLIAVTHASNVLGTVNPIKTITTLAHQHDIPVLVDGAQAVPHLTVDVQDLDCDFYCFSGHKVYGPMGSGILYGKEQWLDALPPYHGGGEMIKEVRFSGSTYNELPFKFEAGTPDVPAALGMKAGLKYLLDQGFEEVIRYEEALLQYATRALLNMGDIRIIGTAREKVGVISFLVGNSHPYDVGTLLDKMGIAVRTGHHCAMPLMEWYSIPGTVRASFALYNTREEVDAFIAALQKVKQMLA